MRHVFKNSSSSDRSEGLSPPQRHMFTELALLNTTKNGNFSGFLVYVPSNFSCLIMSKPTNQEWAIPSLKWQLTCPSLVLDCLKREAVRLSSPPFFPSQEVWLFFTFVISLRKLHSSFKCLSTTIAAQNATRASARLSLATITPGY